MHPNNPPISFENLPNGAALRTEFFCFIKMVAPDDYEDLDGFDLPVRHVSIIIISMTSPLIPLARYAVLNCWYKPIYYRRPFERFSIYIAHKTRGFARYY